PLSFAYAVVKHRVMEIPALLRHSARYVLVQRGFTILLLAVWLGAIRLFTYAVSDLVGTFSNTVLILGLVFGVGLVWISGPLVKRGTERIDRAFSAPHMMRASSCKIWRRKPAPLLTAASSGCSLKNTSRVPSIRNRLLVTWMPEMETWSRNAESPTRFQPKTYRGRSSLSALAQALFPEI
ncbi:MAG TPA: hypothetical protein VF740_06100, partial [Candidatus Acidoferrum sp.]